MSLNFDSAHFQTSFPTWAGVFRVAVAAAVAPVDYVLAGMVAAGLGAEAISLYLGLARTALFERLVELGLPAPHDRPLRRAGGRNPWSTEDVQQLIAWWVAEFTSEASRPGLAAREVRFMRSGGGSAYPIVSASGLSIDLFPNWPLLPGTAACRPRPRTMRRRSTTASGRL